MPISFELHWQYVQFSTYGPACDTYSAPNPDGASVVLTDKEAVHIGH